MSKRWKPGNGEQYWLVAFTDTMQSVWRSDIADNSRWRMGNCFKTKEEAVTALKKITSLLLRLHSEPVTECNQLPKLTVEVFDRPDCPEWAQYAAVDADGDGYYYEDKPRACEADGEWLVDKCIIGTNCIITDDFDPTDWQNSLIERSIKADFDKSLKKVAEQQANAILQKAKERRLPEQYSNAPEKNTLPDWCKVGEWVYLSNEEYDKIESIDGFGINLASGAFINKKYIHEEAVSARLRPYNAEEMKALVGKVVEDKDGNIYLVVCYIPRGRGLLIGGFYFNEQEIIDGGFIIDGKPCGKLEHLENGEWVQ